MPTAAIYVRVSTLDQSCDLQKRELMQYAQSRGFDVVQVYEDKATGTNGERVQLKQMLIDAKARKFDVLICWKLDRLFRSLKGLVTTLQDLSDVGVQFISLKDQIDLTTASGRLMTHLLASFGEFEASLIRERVMAGLAHAKARGKKLGRRPTLDLTQMKIMKQNGMSLRQIAEALGCTKGAVSKSLSKAALQVAGITQSQNKKKTVSNTLV